MKSFEFRTLDTAYPDLCRYVLDNGEKTSPRGLNTLDVGTTSITIFQPWNRILTNKARRINPYFLMAEFLWIATRSNRADMIGFYNKKMWDFSDDGRTLYGAYGPRAMYQLPGIINKINQDNSTRQAILSIFKPSDQLVPTKDFPCNIMLHFIPRNGILDLVVYVRSQDLLLGMPYDFYHWSLIQEMVASAVDMEVGEYTHICGSLHIYEKDIPVIEKISSSRDIIELEPEPHVDGLVKNLRAISTIEYKNRKNKIDEETFESSLQEINNLSEDDIIKNQLKLLLYYKIRHQDGLNFDKSEALELTGYSELIKHLGWE